MRIPASPSCVAAVAEPSVYMVVNHSGGQRCFIMACVLVILVTKSRESSVE